MSGHVHAYERSHPVYNGQPTSDGVVYFNIGVRIFSIQAVQNAD
jgi:hypothetical protein